MTVILLAILAGNPAPVFKEPKPDRCFPPGAYRLDWGVDSRDLVLNRDGTYRWGVAAMPGSAGTYRFDAGKRLFCFTDRFANGNSAFWYVFIDHGGRGVSGGDYTGRCRIYKAAVGP